MSGSGTASVPGPPDPVEPGPEAHPGAGDRSVTIHGPNHAPVTTGDNSPVTVTMLGPLREVADVPPASGPVGVPGRVPLFTGRQAELEELRRALADGPGVVVQAVHGLGGIGKSVLAARYALMHAPRYSQVVWITAQDPAGIEEGLRRFAVALEPQLSPALTSEALAERATGWLASHNGWLLVLDNVTAAGDVEALLAGLDAGNGRFLITSRTAVGWQRLGARAVRLDVLDPAQALDLLGKSIGTAGRELDAGAELCAYLGFLPLAIVQAGAYIAQNQGDVGSGVRWYLQRLAQTPVTVLARGDEQTDPQRTLARIWRVTLDKLADTPLAGDVLRVLAWFAPDAIPAGLLEGLAAQPGLDEAIGRLAAYNMLTRTPGNPADPGAGAVLAVHRLVQAVTRTADPDDPHRTPAGLDRARDTATVLLDAAMPGSRDNPATWAAWRRLIPHIDALGEHAAPDIDTATTAHLLNEAGMFLHDQGAVDRAIIYVARAYSDRQRVLGPDHPDTLGSRNNLASAYRAAGDLGRAIPLYEATLTDSRRVLGPDHPNTLTSRNNLAGAYESAGDLGRAIPLYEATLTDRQRVLGPDHPDTLASRNNLAGAYESAGDLGRAIPLYEATLTDSRRVLGPDHPNTLASRNNLAYAYRAAGDLGRAIPLYEATLTDRQRVLGPDHPNTLASRNNLAGAYESAGDLGRAIPLYEATLTDRQRVLGPDHPNTLASRNNLAYAYRAAGDLGRAIPLYEATLTDSRRVLGPDHPNTLASRNNLAGAYQSAGDLGRAIPLYEATLTDRQRVLGPDHPDTLASRNNLAGAYESAGDLGRAIPLYEATLTDSRRVLGDGHPLTKTVNKNLGIASRIAQAGSST